ncbi:MULTISPECIES: exopolysaccharide Pel transporter PelG [Cetobacterium]|uniref:Exopolysaccharide Pel transporter PelG n=1 Tax=Candidatus Cetobacterium colombiensis TaxID=3073100 RepID=A0ABU4W600_9FUSO|nr:exopolysaccharide Pel transporter PelG [Candidatus Cetobacterium colombiensis]MDX8334953.1 exopolysaccharide Pel transporter PelG [Candidatus Cetobacterium colombiensis]
MAGIGFELKNLFSDENSTFEDIKAIAYSALIGVGPWLITVLTLNILMFVGKQYINLRSERNLFMTAIVYSFIFSQLLTGTIQYLITRFVSDCIYSGEQKKLRATYIGAIKFITLIAFFLGTLYLKNNNLPWFFNYTLIILFCFLSCIWVSMNFISVIKNYTYSIICYLSGNVVAILMGVYLLKYLENQFFKSNLAFSIILSYTVGIGVTFLMLYSYLINIFENSKESEFEFLKAFKRYSSLSFIGIFFNFAMWAHIFINWIYGNSYMVGGVFLSSPLYEIAVFYSFFLTIPTMVYFLVFMETKFFPNYKRYYALLILNGNLEEINDERIKMIKILKEEIYYIMELQFFISFSVALLSKIIFLNFGMDLYLLDLFRIMIFAAYCTVFISVYITIFLYFDSRKEAIIVSLLFFLLSVSLSMITSFLGDQYSGLGFFGAAFITLIFSEVTLDKISKNLNYITFYKQNFTFNINAPLIEKIEIILNKRILLPIIVITILLLSGCSSSHTKDGFNIKTKRNWNTMSYYNKQGYNFDGYNQEGLNSRGFTKEGWNTYTDSPYDYFNFDYAGINSDTGKEIDERGFDYTGHNRITNSKYDKRGFDFQGLNSETKTEYDKAGWTWYGLNKNTNTYYDKEGYNIEGFNENGYNRQGFDSKGNKPPKEELEQLENDFEEEIYDKEGYDKNGYDENGVNREGFNRKGVFVGDGY